MLDFGIQCVISPLFGDIFCTNCINTGVPPVSISQRELGAPPGIMRQRDVTTLTVDLPTKHVVFSDGQALSSEIDPAREHRLLNGLDDLDSTLAR